MKKRTRQFDASGKPEPVLTRAALDEINETLKKKGVKQKADTDLKCLHCGQGAGPAVQCVVRGLLNRPRMSPGSMRHARTYQNRNCLLLEMLRKV